MKNFANNAVDVPSIEIVVRANGVELAIVGFFQVRDDEWDLVFGLSDRELVGTIQEALNMAASSLPAADFDAFGPYTADAGQTPPWK